MEKLRNIARLTKEFSEGNWPRVVDSSKVFLLDTFVAAYICMLSQRFVVISVTMV